MSSFPMGVAFSVGLKVTPVATATKEGAPSHYDVDVGED